MASKLLTGFIAGVVVGILIAPDKGSETRRKLSEKSRDFTDDLNEGYQVLKNKAGDMIRKGREKAQSFRNETGNFGSQT